MKPTPALPAAAGVGSAPSQSRNAERQRRSVGKALGPASVDHLGAPWYAHAVSPAPNEFRKRFYQELQDRPLDPVDDANLYVPLYADRSSSPTDPVGELQTTIEWSSVQSAQLFSGFRGTGKSTELRRLRRGLEASGCVVVLCDMKDYLNMSTPVDISDFLLAAAGAFGEELARDPTSIGESVITEGYWTRFSAFLTRTHVDMTEVGLSAKGSLGEKDVGAIEAGAQIKLNLKQDPTFRQVLQERLKGHLGALVNDVYEFFRDCILTLRKQRKDETLRVVMLLDSIEQIRGTSINARDVAAALETLFEGHADKLRIPSMHVVYTVPPWLKIKAPGVAALYSNFQMIPCVKVRHINGLPCNAGLNELEKIVANRGDWKQLLGDQEALNELLLASGGYLRDLFRLLQTVLRLSRHDGLPASARIRELAMDEVRNSYLPLANDDAEWLQRIHVSHGTELDGQDRLHDLARFFDTHLVLTYRNGAEWVAVHPLVIEQVERQAAAVAARQSKDETA